MYLHTDDRELLYDIVVTVSEQSGIEESIVEKDYYVTLILKELATRNPNVVFKGGTSLSKAYQIIDRFSEDIDITFSEHIGESRRKKLKYNLLKPISDNIGLPIENWNSIESDKDYNHYDFYYNAVTSVGGEILRPYIKLETALMSYSYPTEQKEIKSIIYEFLKDTDPEIIDEYDLHPFLMQTQSLSRTFIDKLFAVCDYFINDKATRNSRHLYDIFKLSPYIKIDAEFIDLVENVRKHRETMDIIITPSARKNVNIIQTAKELISSSFYQCDYEDSTMKLINDNVTYKECIDNYIDIVRKIF